MAKADRELVENALSPDLVEEVWTGNYDKVLPVALQTFEISAVLPVVFYMFRYGHRRGAGNFLATYGPPIGTPAQKRRQTTVGGIAAKLARTEELAGFDAEVEQAILGDLLLCFCLENVRHGLGRDQQVQRVAPTHYLASWIDLPYSVAHLRFVPEMIVAMLANRRTGDHVTPSDETDRTRFPVVNRFEDNPLLRAFSQGVTRRGELLGGSCVRSLRRGGRCRRPGSAPDHSSGPATGDGSQKAQAYSEAGTGRGPDFEPASYRGSRGPPFLG